MLPESEVAVLRSLPPTELHRRLRDLNALGWSLTTLGAALDPPRSKTTVHYWIASVPDSPPLPGLPAPPPRLPAPPPPQRARTPLPPDLASVLAATAASARRRRHWHAPDSRPARASANLTRLARELHDLGVPTADIARAANMSYRAMHKRIQSG